LAKRFVPTARTYAIPKSLYHHVPKRSRNLFWDRLCAWQIIIKRIPLCVWLMFITLLLTRFASSDCLVIPGQYGFFSENGLNAGMMAMAEKLDANESFQVANKASRKVVTGLLAKEEASPIDKEFSVTFGGLVF